MSAQAPTAMRPRRSPNPSTEALPLVAIAKAVSVSIHCATSAERMRDAKEASRIASNMF